MSNTRMFLLFSILCVSTLASNSTNGSQTGLPTSLGMEPRLFGLTGRIVNGTKAAERQFPHQVSLRRSWSGSHFCGGIIMNENVVLTAAHCMYRNHVIIQPWMITVIAGELTLDTATSKGQIKAVESIVMHPAFNYQTLENDITILILKAPFTFTMHVRPALLPLEPIKPGKVCHVSGWGYPADDIPEVSNELMYVDLPILNKTTCRTLLKGVTKVPCGMYCAGYLEGGKDACQGDSGGGMICGDVVVGIVSGGQGCACPRLPGVYSDIFFYKNWLESYNETNSIYLRSEVVSSAEKLTINIVLSSISIFLITFLNLF